MHNVIRVQSRASTRYRVYFNLTLLTMLILKVSETQKMHI
jgi:hypothetical protein